MRHPPVRVSPGFCYGRTDLPLVEGWQAAMPALADRLRTHRLAVIHSSPLNRCLLPAETLGRLLDIPVLVDPRLIELDFGAWEGMRWDDVPRDALDRWAADPEGFSSPGGESGSMLIRRVTAFRDDLAVSGQSALVLSHGGPLRLLGPLLKGEPADLLATAPSMGSLQLVEIRLTQPR